MAVEVVSAPPAPVSDPAKDPVGAIRVHPDANPQDPNACRLIRIAVAHPGEWPWRRLTGTTGKVPSHGADLSEWVPQPLGDVALVLGHRTILTGREVTSG